MSAGTAVRRPVRRLLRQVGSFWPAFAAGALLGCLAIGSNVGLMAVSAYLISKSALVTNVAEVALAITAVRVLAISRAAFRYLERYVTHRGTLRILAELRAWFFEAIEPLAPARLEQPTGDLVARAIADVDTLEDFYVRAALPPIVAAGVTAFAALLLGAFEPLLGLVLLGFLLLTGWLLPVASRRVTRDAATRTVSLRARTEALLLEHVDGLAEVAVYDPDGHAVARQMALAQELDRARERLALLRGVGAGLGVLAASLAALVVLAIAIGLVTDGRLDGVLLAIVPLAAIAAFEATQPMTQAFQHIDASRSAAARIYELIDATPEVVDPPAPAPLPASHGLEVRGLRFRYAPDEPPVLDGLDLELPEGTSLGLVGPSGSGKTTLVSLLLRFRTYREGMILLGGADLRDLAQDEVRAAVAVVPQRIDLFDATVRDNLALADPELTDERMTAACRAAAIDDVIRTLPDGYDTRVGEDGVRLSAGERQRLAIARALVREAPILILDEPTANLDAETERRVLDGLALAMKGRTTLVITHRDAVAERMDRVVSLR
jgi:thiol reductant ABC exporter CydC subunit